MPFLRLCPRSIGAGEQGEALDLHELDGAAERNRTSDPTLTKGVLYP